MRALYIYIYIYIYLFIYLYPLRDFLGPSFPHTLNPKPYTLTADLGSFGPLCKAKSFEAVKALNARSPSTGHPRAST